MILTDEAIKMKLDTGAIVVKPLAHGAVGTNSIDVHLGENILVYTEGIIDPGYEMETKIIKIPKDGLLLQPNRLYLGVTKEYTETHEDVPVLEGKSSVGRLGINIHCTAGFGDVGFCGHWTLEIFVIQQTMVYAGMPIGQIVYHSPFGLPRLGYSHTDRKSSYTDSGEPVPIPSRLYKKLINK